MTDNQEQSEKFLIPRPYSIFRNNFLALYWDRPLGEILNIPGIEIGNKEMNREQTLGEYFLGEKKSFSDFRELIRRNPFVARPILEKLREIIPNSKKFFLQENSTLLNWVPWEIFIAYTEHTATHQILERLEKISHGDSYLEEAKEKFPYGAPRKRTEIYIQRQNANAKVQSINEAIANGIDAISGREKIGQFGLGIKQIFSWLEIGKGEVVVTTKTETGKPLKVRAKKGFDGQVYLKFEEMQESEFAHGTKIEIFDIDVLPEESALIEARIRERFFFVPETSIFINGEKINGYENITIAGKEEKPSPKGEIRVSITSNEIVIQDDGSGMNEQQIVKMFLPGFGKEYRSLTPSEAEIEVDRKGEVLLVKEKGAKKIVFSRNREGVFSIPFSDDAIGIGDYSVVLELGRALNISEGREGLVFDENIVTTLSILVKKTLEAENLTLDQKVGFLNALGYGLETIIAGQEERHQDKIKQMINQALQEIGEVVRPFLNSLINKEKKIILPSLSFYQKIEKGDFFLHPSLIEAAGFNYHQLLEQYGFRRIKDDGWVEEKKGWRVYTASFKNDSQWESLLNQLNQADNNPEIYLQLKRYVFEIAPTIIDRERRIIIIDEQLYQRFLEEKEPTRKAFLAEVIQILANPYVYTSYEAEDPRVVFFNDQKKPASEEPISKDSQRVDSEIKKSISQSRPIYRWIIDKRVFEISETGVLRIYQEGENGLQFQSSRIIPELKGLNVQEITTNENGSWMVLKEGSFRSPLKIAFINKDGFLETIRDIKADIRYKFSVTQNGEICYLTDKNQVYLYNPLGLTQESRFLYQLPNRQDLYLRPFLYQNNLYLVEKVGQQGRVNIVNLQDPQTPMVKNIPFIIEDGFEISNLRFIFNQNDVFLFINFTGKESYYIILFRVDEGKSQLELLTKDYNIKDFSYLTVNSDLEEIGISIIRDLIIFNPQRKTKKHYQMPFFKPDDVEQANLIFSFFSQIQSLFEEEEFSFGTSAWLMANNSLIRPVIKPAFLYSEYIKYSDLLRLLTLLNKKLSTSLSHEKNPFSPIKPDFLYSEDRKYFDLSRLLNLLNDNQFRQTFSSYWRELSTGLSYEEKERLFQRFVENFFWLTQVEGEITEADLDVIFFTHQPKVFFELPDAEKKAFSEVLSKIPNHTQKEKIGLIFEFVLTKGEEQKKIFYQQLERLKKHPAYFENFLTSLSEVSFSEIVKSLQSPEDFPLTSSLRSYFIFLLNQAEILREKKDQQEEIFGWSEVLPENTPLALVAQLRLTDGFFDLEEIREEINKGKQQEINLSYWEGEIKKAVFSQAAEVGVDKREVLQNAIAAILASNKEEGEIVVDYYYRNDRSKFVEEISDNGTGILNWLAFLLPGISDKRGVEQRGFGFFGSGFFKIFETAEQVEVETIVNQNGQRKKYQLVLRVERENGVFKGIIIDRFREKTLFEETPSLTKIKIIRSSETTLGELEAMVGKNTYLTMGGLAFSLSSQRSKPIKLYFIDENGDKKLIEVKTTDVNAYPTSFGDLKTVSSPLPAIMTQEGLRMSTLSYPPAGYLSKVPEVLKDFAQSFHISAVLPGSLGLIKDRSRLADESKYLDEIRRVLATDIVKRAALTLLDEQTSTEKGQQWLVSFKKKFPEDIFTNEEYCHTFLSSRGEKARTIAQKINQGQILNEEDLSFINADINNLILVIIGIEKQRSSGKDSFIRRFMLVQEKSGNTQVVQDIQKQIGPLQETTETSFVFEQKLSSLAQQSSSISQAYQAIEKAEKEGQLEKDGKSIDVLSIEEKSIIVNLCQALGLKEIYFVPSRILGNAVGMFKEGDIYLNEDLLEKDRRTRLERIIHELAHYLERKSFGWQEGMLDTQDEIHYSFTHQQDSDFAYFYRLVALVLARQLINFST